MFLPPPPVSLHHSPLPPSCHFLPPALPSISTSSSSLRLEYLPALKTRLVHLLREEGNVERAIEFLDAYGMSREDLMEVGRKEGREEGREGGRETGVPCTWLVD